MARDRISAPAAKFSPEIVWVGFANSEFLVLLVHDQRGVDNC